MHPIIPVDHPRRNCHQGVQSQIGRALRVKGKGRGKGKLDRESGSSVAEFTCLSARGHQVLVRRVRRRMGLCPRFFIQTEVYSGHISSDCVLSWNSVQLRGFYGSFKLPSKFSSQLKSYLPKVNWDGSELEDSLPRQFLFGKEDPHCLDQI